MKKNFMILFAAAVIFLAACGPTGPQKVLDDVAAALSKNDSVAFLANIDMDRFTANHISNMTQNDEALSSLNALGNMLGLGNIDDLIGSVMDMRGKLQQEFDRGVSSGELVVQCRRSEKPDCPWVPQSLKSAEVVELAENAAIARVTTPAKLTSWLAMSKINGQWLIVGQAVLEKQASDYALAGAANTPPAKAGEKTTDI